MNTAKRTNGFTIVELLIVIVVIAVLAAITIVAYNGIQNRAKASAAQSAVAQATKKVLSYSIENSDQYPASLAAIGVTNSGSTVYEYSVNNSVSPRTYCVTATTSNVSYYESSTTPNPTVGACAGHALNGMATITNLITNGSLETSASGWTGSSASLSPQRVQDGSPWVFTGTRGDTAAASIRAAFTLPSAVVSGNTYTASALVKLSAASGSRTLQIAVRQAATTTNVISQDYTFAPFESKRISVTGVLNVASVYVNLYSLTGSIGDTFTIDEVMLTEGTSVYPYYDGDSPGWVWNGTPGQSSSTGPAPTP